MTTKVVFLVVLLGVASSKLPDRRRCDPEQRRTRPTLCSNYKNIKHLDDIQTKLEERQVMLQHRIDAMEGATKVQLESANSNISELQGSVANLSSSIQELLRMKLQTEMEFRAAETQLEKHKVDIASLKREVQKLVKHRERVGGNFSEIEERLDTTERQLGEKKAKLENLETETEAALNDTQRLMKLYQDELSHLNSTARELEVKVEARMEATETKLEAELQKIQNKSEALSTKLNAQKAGVEGFKVETDRKFSHVDEQLKTQKAAEDQQRRDIDSLKRETAGMNHRLASAEERLVEQNGLKLEVNSLKAEVYAKVAFSASVIESHGVFTGPYTRGTNGCVIFSKVFANIGNAYNKNTGVFTAPLKGLYHFTFMTFGYNSHTSGAILLKNGHYQVSTWEFTGPDTSDTTSNTVILQLNAGETVNIKLWRGGKIHTGVFTGFLVFTTP